MRRAAALLLAALLCLGLCACEEEPAVVPESPQQEMPEVSLRAKGLSLAYDPDESLHPITGGSQVNRMLNSLVYEGLYGLDEAFTPQPVLAQSASVDESGLVWTVVLAPNAVFSDGTPLEPGHVVSSLNKARRSDLYGGRLAGMVSVKAADGAVIITLSEPNGALPALLDVPIVLETEESEVPLGTGRYCYAGAEDGLYLVANYNHGTGLPYDIINLYPVTSAAQRIAAFDGGSVSAVVTDLLDPYALGYSCDYEAWDYATTDLLYVGFRAAEGPCSSPLVRRAFSNAFDRVSVVENLLGGHGDAAALPVSPLSEEWMTESAAMLDYDPQGAAQLLTEAGYVKNEEDGLLYSGRKPLAVTLLVNSDNPKKSAVADFLAAALTELGVAVTVTGLPWRDYIKALEAGTFDLYLGEVRLTGDFDVMPLLTGSLNYGGYDPTPLAEKLAEWRASTGLVRHWASKALWQDFAEEVPIAPLCFKRESLLVRRDTASGMTPVWGDPFRGLESWVPAKKAQK